MPSKYNTCYEDPGKQILILYGSEYGFSEELARKLFDRFTEEEDGASLGLQPRVLNSKHYKLVDYTREQVILHIFSTTGDGDCVYVHMCTRHTCVCMYVCTFVCKYMCINNNGVSVCVGGVVRVSMVCMCVIEYALYIIWMCTHIILMYAYVLYILMYSVLMLYVCMYTYIISYYTVRACVLCVLVWVVFCGNSTYCIHVCVERYMHVWMGIGYRYLCSMFDV